MRCGASAGGAGSVQARGEPSPTTAPTNQNTAPTPISTPADFAGTKMRAYNPATTKIAQQVKAQPVTIQLAECGASTCG